MRIYSSYVSILN